MNGPHCLLAHGADCRVAPAEFAITHVPLLGRQPHLAYLCRRHVMDMLALHQVQTLHIVSPWRVGLPGVPFE